MILMRFLFPLNNLVYENDWQVVDDINENLNYFKQFGGSYDHALKSYLKK